MILQAIATVILLVHVVSGQHAIEHPQARVLSVSGEIAPKFRRIALIETFVLLNVPQKEPKGTCVRAVNGNVSHAALHDERPFPGRSIGGVLSIPFGIFEGMSRVKVSFPRRDDESSVCGEPDSLTGGVKLARLIIGVRANSVQNIWNRKFVVDNYCMQGGAFSCIFHANAKINRFSIFNRGCEYHRDNPEPRPIIRDGSFTGFVQLPLQRGGAYRGLVPCKVREYGKEKGEQRDQIMWKMIADRPIPPLEKSPRFFAQFAADHSSALPAVSFLLDGGLVF